MKWSLSLLVLVSALSANTSCARSVSALLVPKLELHAQLQQTRANGSLASTLVQHTSQQLHAGFSAWLRWQPTVYAAQVPVRYELSPSAWMAPCDDDDSDCFAEFARDEHDIAAELRDTP